MPEDDGYNDGAKKMRSLKPDVLPEDQKEGGGETNQMTDQKTDARVISAREDKRRRETLGSNSSLADRFQRFKHGQPIIPGGKQEEKRDCYR